MLCRLVASYSLPLWGRAGRGVRGAPRGYAVGRDGKTVSSGLEAATKVGVGVEARDGEGWLVLIAEGAVDGEAGRGGAGKDTVGVERRGYGGRRGPSTAPSHAWRALGLLPSRAVPRHATPCRVVQTQGAVQCSGLSVLKPAPAPDREVERRSAGC